jgi:thiamine biosynthesis lipoprotein
VKSRAALAALLAVCASCAAPTHDRAPSTAIRRVERAVSLMGTQVELVAYAADAEAAAASLDAVVRQLEAIEEELSTWRDDTVLAAFNRHPVGERWRIPGRLCAEIGEVLEWQKATGGAFDPFIRALVDAWGIREEGRVPSAQELDAARRNSGAHLVEYNREECWLRRTRDVRIDEGAFGKGLALDRLKDLALPFPLTAWLANLGGHVAVYGRPPEPWKIGVAHPYERDRTMFDVRLDSGSFDTSGESERDRMVGATRVRHIIDPRNGRPATFSGSVAVWHERAFVADIVATALYVMGPDEGLRWAEQSGFAVMFLVPASTGDVNIRSTTAFRRKFR